MDQLQEVYEVVTQFDQMAGHKIQPQKTTMHLTNKGEAKEAEHLTFDGVNPRVNKSETLIGEPVNVAATQCNKLANNRVVKAIAFAQKVLGVPTSRYRRTILIGTSAIPRFTFSCLWSAPTQRRLKHLRATVVTGVFGNSSLMRAPEVVLGILNDPNRIEPTTAMNCHALNTARRMLRHLYGQHQESAPGCCAE